MPVEGEHVIKERERKPCRPAVGRAEAHHECEAFRAPRRVCGDHIGNAEGQVLRDDRSRRTAIGAEFPSRSRAMCIAGSVGNHDDARPEPHETVVSEVRSGPRADLYSGADPHFHIAVACRNERNDDDERGGECYASERATISAVIAPTTLHNTFTASLLSHVTPPACTVYAPQE